jgi:hypothetical protein
MLQRISNRRIWGFAAAMVLALGPASPVFAQSAAECAAMADRAARSSNSVVGGAAAGAAGGAAIGAIVSDGRGCRGRHCRGGSRSRSDDAWRGAAVGAVAGGAAGAYQQNERYKRVYDDCMAGYR